MWTYKTYFFGDTEYFEYDAWGQTGAAATEKMYPFLESLLSFLEMDSAILESEIETICVYWEQFLSTDDCAYSEQAMQLLGKLAAQHIYFQLIYLQWFERFSKGQLTQTMVNELRLLPAQLTAYRQQAQRYIDLVLDIDQVGRDTQRNARRSAGAFAFHAIPVSFEPVDADACGAVLYPETIRDLIDFSLRECITRGIPVRHCKNCGRYFPLTTRVTAEYCGRPTAGRKSCRDRSEAQAWTKAQQDNKGFKEYRREYKRRFAWRKAGKITNEQFTAWCKHAKEKEKEYDEEIITFQELHSWLKQ